MREGRGIYILGSLDQWDVDFIVAKDLPNEKGNEQWVSFLVDYFVNHRECTW